MYPYIGDKHEHIRSNYLTPRYLKVMHLIRCPVAQIASCTSHTSISHEFIRSHMLLQAYTGRVVNNITNNHFIHHQNTTQISKIRPLLGKKTTHENSLWLDRNYSTFFRERINVVSNKCHIVYCTLIFEPVFSYYLPLIYIE